VPSIPAFVGKSPLRLGVIRSFRYGESANRTVDQLNADGRVDHATGLSPLYQLLLNNRIQAMVLEPFDFPALVEKKIRAATDIIEFADPSIRHGVIMSRKAIPANELDKWRALVDDMRADGTVRAIFEKYFKPALAAEMTNF
jgi:polar amino acid transport system substrate-binding protein